MRSKPEAGTTLERINRYNGVTNEICMINAPKQTGDNTEIHRVERLSIHAIHGKISLKV